MLLDNIMLRLSKLESKVDTIIVINGTASNLTNGTAAPGAGATTAEKVNVAGTLRSRYLQVDCVV